eukprot:CAMPEP_0172531642 /NCGR_PEP_ID=MMETSP1067-20121228/4962_1 /TAXON_ID=265564 ORGANISM="Thalassiosira punctigera, Strain Tpunct2005C2" /NCGR_SAMPLE_ID=MMETSP1067 /ASSEMBLY_ACC=CAM_ASM_000444 /LENGTH=501 /DNA_ID=CAMNT_0013316041 /DNA_START=107 /DNA_END=1612 /DNA_ORIENTATION=+
MGSAISSTLSLGLTYCACTSASSICNACLGQTSPNTSGRRRSVLLLALSVLLALTFQYSLAPAILGDDNGWWNALRKTPGVGKHVYKSWTDGCRGYLEEEGAGEEEVIIDEEDGDAANQLNGPYGQCAGNAGVYRPTLFSFLFFACAAGASYARPSLNREVWPAKYCVYLLLVVGSVFMSNRPWFLGIFLHLSRLGAMVFIVVQQIILIDLAYNWNDSWVGKADAADRLEWGSGAKWLRATIAVCVAFYALALAGIGLLYHFFGGCGGNTAIVTMTLLGVVAVTALQLSGVDGSLLTSSVISLYVVYLGYSAVSKNPHGACNPHLAGENDAWEIVMGLFLTALSLAWTGWSWTAEDRLSGDGVGRARSLGRSGATFRRGQDPLLDLDDPMLEYDDEDRPPSGLALSSEDGADDVLSSHSSEVWKLNAILALVSCWVAMSLTGWGSISGGIVEEEGVEIHTAANPQVGKVNMAMIAVSQWVALMLYAWTLMAPRLFPDRDFS